jgi:hypothetical protein
MKNNEKTMKNNEQNNLKFKIYLFYYIYGVI